MADIRDDVFFATVAELNASLLAREFSVEELTRAFLNRLETVGPRYNALALLLRPQALRKARDVDGELKRGRTRGPLQGIPYGVKDLLSYAGQPTAWGARPYVGQVFDEHATVIRKLENTGAVLLGKLAMIELAGAGGYSSPAASISGPGLNPWNRSHWSGGSSSGSATAVAAGLVTFALGSETSGSIVSPAAYCGVSGLRPTYGLVSRHLAMPLSWTMDKIGPLCRSAEDCGLVLQVISGGDSEDSGSAGKSFYYLPQFVRKFQDLRVGYAAVDFDERPQPAARAVFQEALSVLRGLGLQWKQAELPDLPYSLVTGTVISAEGSAVFEPLIRSGGVDALADAKQIAGLKAGLEIAATDYLKAMRIRGQIRRELRKLFADVDLLVAPSRTGVAPLVRQPLDSPPPGGPEPASRGLRDLIQAGNLAGLPALSLPCGFVDGLPVAISLVGRPFTENNLIAIGREFQKQTDWHRRRPPL